MWGTTSLDLLSIDQHELIPHGQPPIPTPLERRSLSTSKPLGAIVLASVPTNLDTGKRQAPRVTLQDGDPSRGTYENPCRPDDLVHALDMPLQVVGAF